MEQNSNQNKQNIMSQQSNGQKSSRFYDQYDFEIAKEPHKLQRANELQTKAFNAQKANTQSQRMNAIQTQEDWNQRQQHDLEIANELGKQYAQNVAKTRVPNQNKYDVEFALPNENKSVRGNAFPNNNTANQFNRNKQQNKQPNYSNVDPETDSNRFEKGNN